MDRLTELARDLEMAGRLGVDIDTLQKENQRLIEQNNKLTDLLMAGERLYGNLMLKAIMGEAFSPLPDNTCYSGSHI